MLLQLIKRACPQVLPLRQAGLLGCSLVFFSLVSNALDDIGLILVKDTLFVLLFLCSQIFLLLLSGWVMRELGVVSIAYVHFQFFDVSFGLLRTKSLIVFFSFCCLTSASKSLSCFKAKLLFLFSHVLLFTIENLIPSFICIITTFNYFDFFLFLIYN